MPPSRSDTTDAIRQTLILGLLAVTMVFAPLIRAGQPPLALMGLQLLAVALIAAALWQRPALRWSEVVGLALLVLVPLLYATSAFAKERVSPMTPALLAAYGSITGMPFQTVVELTLTILP